MKQQNRPHVSVKQQNLPHVSGDKADFFLILE